MLHQLEVVGRVVPLEVTTHVVSQVITRNIKLSGILSPQSAILVLLRNEQAVLAARIGSDGVSLP